jgi:antitoxin component HigA of HigAB toxin-antitoxin module
MATVDLIAKNLVINYITAHPESQVAFLTFLKEFEYYRLRSVDGVRIMGTISAGPNYAVEVQINSYLKAACVLWLGNKKEHSLYSEEKRRKYSEFIENAYTENAIANAPAFSENTYEDLKTHAVYEKALARAVSILDAKPGTQEFIEQEQLIPLITKYEANHLDFPKLKLLDVIKFKMEQSSRVPDDFIPLLKKKENVDLFFSGKKMLAKGYLQKLCTRVGIKFPITDDDLSSF